VTLAAAGTVLLALAGAAFFAAGTAGLLRFPDLHSRLHALTKADNVGLGLVAAALAVRSGSAGVAAKLALVWLLALLASAAASYALAGGALAREPERDRGDA
jgi:multicomponent Na+:H+ antiporter subunit G